MSLSKAKNPPLLSQLRRGQLDCLGLAESSLASAVCVLQENHHVVFELTEKLFPDVGLPPPFPLLPSDFQTQACLFPSVLQLPPDSVIRNDKNTKTE